ncbi:hypothetical protein ACFLWL_03135 [Chloroflexota bacterium]
MDFGILAVIIWFGCFLVVPVDSAFRGVSPVFWRLAALVGGPFALLAYGIVRELAGGRRAA